MNKKEYSKPLPTVTVWNKRFWEGTKQHKMVVQKCADCGKLRIPAGPVCPDCLSGNSQWEEVKGTGKVDTWVVFHQLYYEGFAGDIPYNATTVTLDEGAKLVTNLVNVKNEDIRIGMPVRVVYDDVTEEITLPKFEPVS